MTKRTKQAIEAAETCSEEFYSEDMARGYADGLAYATDGAISDIDVKRVNIGRVVKWVVTFEDKEVTRL